MIRITKDHRTDDGYLFWRGETFDPVSGPDASGAEVKTAGEYVWLPSDIYETVA